MWHRVREENKDSQLWDIGRKIGALWRELDDCEKQVYQEEFEMDKAEYDRQMKTYQNSAAYQAYLAASRSQGPLQEIIETSAMQPVRLGMHKPSSGKERQLNPPTATATRLEPGVFIQAIDEDDGISLMLLSDAFEYLLPRVYKELATVSALCTGWVGVDLSTPGG